MPSKQSLINASYELSEAICCAEHPFEDFHPDYKKDKDAFRKLIAARTGIENSMNRYFKDANKRILDSIDWVTYNRELIQAQEFTREIDFAGESLALTVAFNDALPDVYEVGILNAEINAGFESGLSAGDLSFQREIQEHGLGLAKQLTKTTEKRIKKVLKDSLDNKISQEEAQKKITKAVKDPQRAKMIARTEVVDAHSRAVQLAGENMGATSKQWLTALNPCPICEPLDGVIVPMDKAFHTSVGLKQGPTAHVFCLCLLKLIFG